MADLYRLANMFCALNTSVYFILYKLYHPCEWNGQITRTEPEGVVRINRLLHECGWYNKFISG